MSCGYHLVSRSIQDQPTKHSGVGYRGLTNEKKLQSKRNQTFTEVYITHIFLFAYSGSVFWNVLPPSSLRNPAFMLQESNILGLEEGTNTYLLHCQSHEIPFQGSLLLSPFPWAPRPHCCSCETRSQKGIPYGRIYNSFLKEHMGQTLGYWINICLRSAWKLLYHVANYGKIHIIWSHL